MSTMTRDQRAMQLWSVLIFAARNQQLLSYTTVEKLTGLPKFSLGDFLGVVAGYCIVHKLPALTLLVVKEETGVPGAELPGSSDVFRGQARVFVYDWFSHGIPSPEDFDAASERMRERRNTASAD